MSQIWENGLKCLMRAGWVIWTFVPYHWGYEKHDWSTHQYKQAFHSWGNSWEMSTNLSFADLLNCYGMSPLQKKCIQNWYNGCSLNSLRASI
jgi:hypothetical protein